MNKSSTSQLFTALLMVFTLWLMPMVVMAEILIIQENTLIDYDNLEYENYDIEVLAGTLTINGTHDFNSMWLKNTSILTHSIETPHKLKLILAGELNIEPDAKIDLSAKGNSYSIDSGSFTGGSYGGKGTGNSNPVYGNALEPVDYGTGGRGGDIDGIQLLDSRGGGAIHLTANSLVLDGEILADGEQNITNIAGASGGSIYINVDELIGAGNINANGSHGGKNTYGGGGRAAVYYNSIVEGGDGQGINISARAGDIDGMSTATAGSSYLKNKQTSESFFELIGVGSNTVEAIIFDNVLDENTHLLVNGANVIVQQPVSGLLKVTGGSVVTFKDSVNSSQIVLNYSEVSFEQAVVSDDMSINHSQVTFLDSWETSQNRDILIEHSTVDIHGPWIHPASRDLHLINSELTTPLVNNQIRQWNNITLDDNSKLSHQQANKNDAELLHGITWQANEIKIDETSKIDVSAKGYTYSESVGLDSGGSYGGKGGGNSNSVYGDIFEPVDYGTGGHGHSGVNELPDYQETSTRGGGVVHLTANVLELNGEILANGEYVENGEVSLFSGGSGGSIYINVNELKGIGYIAAEGASGDSGLDGGGGRIAVYYNSNTGNLDITARAGSTDGQSTAEPGSSYIKNKLTSEATFEIIGEGADVSEPIIFDQIIDENSHLLVDEANVVVQQEVTGSLKIKGDAEVVFIERVSSGQMNLEDSIVYFEKAVISDDIYIYNSDITFLSSWTTSLDRDIVIDDGSTVDIRGAWTHPANRDLSLFNSELITPLVNNHIRHWNNITLEDDSWVWHQDGKRNNGLLPGIIWQANQIIIDETSGFDVDSDGYNFDETAGLSTGGSYGGKGAGDSNLVYGDQYEPLDYGTGGRGSDELTTTLGGGVVHLTANVLELHGEIWANGENTDISLTGGGSGGSIYLNVKELIGNGLINASGGESIDDIGGGGGRVALYYVTKDATVDLSKYVAKAGGTTADDGTVYIQQVEPKTYITDTTAKGIFAQQPDSFTISFINEIDPNSLSIEDITLKTGNDIVVIQSIVPVIDNQYQINLGTPLTDGNYELIVGPNILSKFGYGMDQDNDDITNEDPDDRFISSFLIDTIKPVPATISSHLIGQVVNTTIFKTTIRGTREDNTRVLINGIEVVPFGSGNWSVIDYPLQDGLNTLHIVIEDEAGNQSDVIDLLINANDIDLLPPQITERSPLGVFNTQPQQIKIVFEEANTINQDVSKISLLHNGQEILQGGTIINNTFVLDLGTDLPKGEYNVQVLLEDEDGNQTQETYSFYYIEKYPYQNIIHVGANYEHTSVQSAIDAASEGDLILIEEGEYIGEIVIDKLLFLKGNTNDPSQVILSKNGGGYDAPYSGTVNIDIAEPTSNKNSPIIIEGLTVRSNDAYSWHQALSIINNNHPVVISKSRLLPANGSSYTLYGPYEQSGSSSLFIINSYIQKSYSHSYGLNSPQTYLLSSELDTTISYYQSSEQFKIADYVTTATDNYGPNFGTQLLEVNESLYIINTSVAQSPLASLQAINVYFSLGINAQTFSLDDITLTGPGAPLISSIEAVDSSNYILHLSSALDSGSYVLTIGPNIEDSAAHLMDQNKNRLVGELDDSYQKNFTIDNDNPLQPAINNLDLAPQINRVNTTSFSFSGGREDDTAIVINDIELVTSGSGDWSITDFSLNEGLNTLSIYARDLAGNQSQPYDVIISVDSQRPIVGQVTPTGHLDTQPYLITINYTELGSVIDLTASEISLKQQTNSIDFTRSLETNSLLLTLNQPLADGSYELSVRLHDTHGNQSDQSLFQLTVDTQAPDAPVVQPLPQITQIQTLLIEGTKESDSVIFLNGEIVYQQTGTQWSYQVTLVSGANELHFSQQDSSANISPETLINVNFDNIAPGDINLIASGDGDGHSIALDWTAYDEYSNGADIDHYAIYLSDTPFSSVEQLQAVNTLPAGQQQFNLDNLILGNSYYIAVVAVDNFNNANLQVSSTAIQVRDTQAPELIASISVQSEREQLSIGWTDESPASDLSHYELSLNGQSAVSINPGNYTYTFNQLTPVTFRII